MKSIGPNLAVLADGDLPQVQICNKCMHRGTGREKIKPLRSKQLSDVWKNPECSFPQHVKVS